MTSTPDGFVATWRYTASSLWIYVAIGCAGPVIRAASDAVQGTAVARNVALLVVIAGLLWFSCRPLINAAKSGLGHDELTWSYRASLLAPALVVIPLAWIAPTFPSGIVMVPWVIVSLLAIDMPSKVRNYGLPVVLVALIATSAIGGLDQLRSLDVSGVYALGFITVFIPGAVVFQVWLWELMLQVRSSGEAEAELAAVRERLRLAADLHDVQGHHLQVIALKSELAERQIDRDPDAARGSMQEVQQVARDAITETKDIVRGYRRTNLGEEIANAASVLEAAGAHVVVACDEGLDEPLFALTLREATTNILRHSNARTVRITARPGGLLITNDGAVDAASTQGSGLSALTERVAAGGGRLSVRHEGQDFTVEVQL